MLFISEERLRLLVKREVEVGVAARDKAAMQEGWDHAWRIEEKLRDTMAILNSEEFIDQVVERLNKKQLRRQR